MSFGPTLISITYAKSKMAIDIGGLSNKKTPSARGSEDWENVANFCQGTEIFLEVGINEPEEIPTNLCRRNNNRSRCCKSTAPRLTFLTETFLR